MESLGGDIVGVVPRTRIPIALALLAGLAACGSGRPGSFGSPSDSAARQTLTAFAAASLKPTFTELGKRFEAGHAGSTVVFSFAGSSDLVSQLTNGAPADVFASADLRTMEQATGAGLADGTPVRFASNSLQIAVPTDNPGQVTSLRDLTRTDVTVAVCAPQVPCGAATEALERAAGITLTPVTEESSVTDVLAKVSTGQVEAGLVYVTDVRAAGGKVAGIPFAESSAAMNVYPICVLAASRNKDLARQFVELVTGGEGRQVLDAAGFAAP